MTVYEKYKKLRDYIEWLSQYGDSGDFRDSAADLLKEIDEEEQEDDLTD